EPGGVDVLAVCTHWTRTLGSPVAAREKQRDGIGLLAEHDGFDIVVGLRPYILDALVGVTSLAALARLVIERGEPRAERREGLGGLHAADDREARFGGHGKWERGRHARFWEKAGGDARAPNELVSAFLEQRKELRLGDPPSRKAPAGRCVFSKHVGREVRR